MWRQARGSVSPISWMLGSEPRLLTLCPPHFGPGLIRRGMRRCCFKPPEGHKRTAFPCMPGETHFVSRIAHKSLELHPDSLYPPPDTQTQARTSLALEPKQGTAANHSRRLGGRSREEQASWDRCLQMTEMKHAWRTHNCSSQGNAIKTRKPKHRPSGPFPFSF